MILFTSVLANSAALCSFLCQHCSSRHTVLTHQNRIDPCLAGVFGHKAASPEGARSSDSKRNRDGTYVAA